MCTQVGQVQEVGVLTGRTGAGVGVHTGGHRRRGGCAGQVQEALCTQVGQVQEEGVHTGRTGAGGERAHR